MVICCFYNGHFFTSLNSMPNFHENGVFLNTKDMLFDMKILQLFLHDYYLVDLVDFRTNEPFYKDHIILEYTDYYTILFLVLSKY